MHTPSSKLTAPPPIFFLTTQTGAVNIDRSTHPIIHTTVIIAYNRGEQSITAAGRTPPPPSSWYAPAAKA
jgi:hypothetical protein